MTKKKHILGFGDKIEYTEILGNILYLNMKPYNQFFEHKLYDADFETFGISRGNVSSKFISGPILIFPKCQRKIQFYRSFGNGIIIGQRNIQEGIYDPGCLPSYPYYDDYEPPILIIKKVYPFWKVATGMNKIEYVHKDSLSSECEDLLKCKYDQEYFMKKYCIIKRLKYPL